MSKIQMKIESINEESRAFIPGLEISKSEKHYTSAVEATIAPIASKLFGFPWTESVKIEKDRVVVEKQSWVEWDILEEPLANLISEHFEALVETGAGQIEENPLPKVSKSDGTSYGSTSLPLFEKVKTLIELEINPSVASHGGVIEAVGVDEKGSVFIKMLGGCQGCAMSQATLKDGIEKSLMEKYPEISSVIDVTDHDSGDKPFY